MPTEGSSFRVHVDPSIDRGLNHGPDHAQAVADGFGCCGQRDLLVLVEQLTDGAVERVAGDGEIFNRVPEVPGATADLVFIGPLGENSSNDCRAGLGHGIQLRTNGVAGVLEDRGDLAFLVCGEFELLQQLAQVAALGSVLGEASEWIGGCLQAEAVDGE